MQIVVRVVISLAIVATMVVGACVDGRSPVDPGGLADGGLQLLPSFVALAGTADEVAINRIRVTVTLASNDSVLTILEQNVDPTAEEWTLEVQVDLPPEGTSTLVLTIELLNVQAGGQETVEWCGRVEQTVTPGESNTVQQVEVYRGPLENLAVESVTIADPARTVLVEGDTVRLSATIQGGGEKAQLYWGVLDASLASVSGDGLLTTILPGHVQVVAVAGPRSDTVTIQVLQAVVGLELDPDTLLMTSVGDTATMGMVVVDPRGAAVVGAEVSWGLSNPAVVQDLGDGRFVAVANGFTTITVTGQRTQVVASLAADTAVTAEGFILISQTAATLAVEPAGATLNALGRTVQFTAEAHDSLGTRLDSAVVIWISRDTLVVMVDPVGLATSVGNGEATIVAVSGAARDSAEVMVAQVAAVVHVLPESDTLRAIGATLQMSAEVLDSLDVPIVHRLPVWESSDSAIVTVDSLGLVTAVTTGEVLITATLDSIADTATVVFRLPPDAVIVTPAADTLNYLGDNTLFTAVVLDEVADTIQDVVVTWTMEDTQVASVDSTGLVVALAVGATRVTALVDSVSAAAEVVVRQVLAGLTIEPATVTVAQGDTLVMTAVPVDSGGSVVSGEANWATSHASRAAVDPVADQQARVVALDTGSVTITAVMDGIQGTAAMVIEEATAFGLKVTPAFDTMSVGGTRTFTTQAFDVWDNPISVTPTWTSDDPAVAGVDAGGVATGVAVGVARIIPSADATADTATLAVLDAGALLGTAFPDGFIHAEVVAGQAVAVPVKLDMSRVGTSGDLGSAQFTLTYDAAVLHLDSAAVGVSGLGLFNGDNPGTVAFSMAHTDVQGTTDVTMLTVYFTVNAVAAGTTSQLGLVFTAVPSKTDLTLHTAPLVVTGRIKVVSP